MRADISGAVAFCSDVIVRASALVAATKKAKTTPGAGRTAAVTQEAETPSTAGRCGVGTSGRGVEAQDGRGV